MPGCGCIVPGVATLGVQFLLVEKHVQTMTKKSLAGYICYSIGNGLRGWYT